MSYLKRIARDNIKVFIGSGGWSSLFLLQVEWLQVEVEISMERWKLWVHVFMNLGSFSVGIWEDRSGRVI